MQAQPRRITVSVPGKVLVCGGYLITDGLSSGIVVATENNRQEYLLQRNPSHCSSVGKTGLGSSACLVTSLTATLVSYFDKTIPVSNTDQYASFINKTFRISHYVHSLLQGRYGSGFDVSCCCYGTQIFKQGERKPIKSESNIQEKEINQRIEWEDIPLPDLHIFDHTLHDGSIQLLSPFPSALWICICEIGDGSSTVSLASQLNEWKKKAKEGEKTSEQQSYDIFNQLREVNQQLIEDIVKLKQKENEITQNYKKDVKCASFQEELNTWRFSNEESDIQQSPYKQNQTTHQLISRVSQSFRRYKHSLLRITEESKVQIVPPFAEQLAESAEQVPGVLACGVPGAGGEDALFIIAISQAVIVHVFEALEVVAERSHRLIVLQRPFQIPCGYEDDEEMQQSGLRFE
ncbi:MAG: putative Phosphomevalonate kinase [Streblomastix strix]|uniref:phosphomevalonate kinase n=1 Tax=Streblomastix strix TaxID=222440 RepID=A0A5J4W0W0_9EUKA|nr:MAG: putative Phosphomevalonate kinase [Streblomastix strix]